MSRPFLHRWGVLAVLTAVLILTTSCNSTPPEAADPASQIPTITLVENPWPTAQLNAAVADILIETELGYPVVITTLEESEQWETIALGEADASLEIWPTNNQAQMTQYLEIDGRVLHGGPLGPQATVGWYVPTYVVDAHPQLATWQGLQDPTLATLFATAETGNSGRFLAGDLSWTQYDADIITNLGLPLEVVTAGSEDALLTAVETAYSRQEPILFYFYEPHALFNRLDLTRVELPAYSPECYADPPSGSINCAYPTDTLFKIINPELQTTAPDVFAFLSNMNYSNDAQIYMLAKLAEGLTAKEAAQAWVDTHEATWRPWLP